MYFAKNIKYLRENKNITKSGIARDLNLQRNSYKKLESGISSDPKLSTVIALSKYYKMSLDDLVLNDLSKEAKK